MAPLARFRAVIDQSGEAILVIEPETGRFVDANETALRWLDLSHEQLLSLTTCDVDVEFPLELPQSRAAPGKDLRNRSRPLVCGRVHRRRDGTDFPVEVSVTEIHFDDRPYTLVVARESKQPRQVERALRESEDRYQTLLNSARDAAYLTSGDGRIAAVNEATIDLLGYTREELEGLQVSKLYDVLDTALFHEAIEEHGLVRDFKVRLRAKDGSSVPGSLTALTRRAGDGGAGGLQCLFQPLKEETTAGEAAEAPPTDRAAPQDEEPAVVVSWRRKTPRVLQAGDPTPRNAVRPKREPLTLSQEPEEARYKPWLLLLALGLVTAVFGWSRLVVLTYPYDSGLQEWQLAVRALSVALFAVGAVGQRWRHAAKGVAVGVLLLAVALLITYAIYVRSLPFELAERVPGTDAALNSLVLGASVFSAAVVLLCGWVSWRLWRGPPGS